MALSEAAQKVADQKMFGQPRARIDREDEFVEPTFPVVEDLPAEDSYVTFLGNGHGTFVSRFVNNGDPVKSGDTIWMVVSMCAIQLRSHWQDPRTNEYRPMWRLATEPEIELVEHLKDTSNPSAAGRRELAKQARTDAVDSGQASYETEQEHAEKEAVKSTRKSRRRRTSND